MPRGKNRTIRKGRPSGISRLSTSQLLTEIKWRREALSDQLEAINSEMAALGADIEQSAPLVRRGPGRPKGSTAAAGRATRRGHNGNGKGLPALLHSLLQGKTMSVQEMAGAAKKAGHKSKSKNFRAIVSLALLNHRPMFKRVSRGQYTAK